MEDDSEPHIYTHLWGFDDRNERAKVMRMYGILDGPPELMKATFSGNGPDQRIGKMIIRKKPDE